jgi:hypothetical protein
MISFSTSGSTSKTSAFLKAMQSQSFYSDLQRLAERGVVALSQATPQDSGLTANSWGYEIDTSNGGARITWFNTHSQAGVNVAVILQYGHGTGTGGYVAGRDYINPAIKPVMDEIADLVWKKVRSS